MATHRNISSPGFQAAHTSCRIPPTRPRTTFDHSFSIRTRTRTCLSKSNGASPPAAALCMPYYIYPVPASFARGGIRADDRRFLEEGLSSVFVSDSVSVFFLSRGSCRGGKRRASGVVGDFPVETKDQPRRTKSEESGSNRCVASVLFEETREFLVHSEGTISDGNVESPQGG